METNHRTSRSGYPPDWPGLMPVGIVVFGPPAVPAQRLMGLQSAVYRLIVWLGTPRSAPETGKLAGRPRALSQLPAE